MTTFLDTVAADLYARYDNNLSQCCLVFPNRRSRLFFAQSLSKLISKPLWQPTYKSIEEVIEEQTGQKSSDTFSLLLELYEIYTRILQSEETFDRFYFWGEVMLHDFDLIDKYLVNAKALFTNLKEQKELEGDFSFLSDEQIAHIRQFWSSFSPEKSTLQDQFLTVWEALGAIYETFNQELKAKGMAYEGMLYRQVANAEFHTETDNEHFVFIGFNALNECEKTLFRQLKKQGKAEFYWDYDIYYLNNTAQEAGMFLRQNLIEFPSSLSPLHFSNFHTSKKIDIISAPSDAIQAKLLPQIITEMNVPANSQTVVVLADEQLLIPSLHALPAVAQDINVTMGYPLKQTPIYALIELMLRIHRKAKTKNKHTRYYHRDVLPLLNHPYIKTIAGKAAEHYTNEIIQKNKVYVSPSDFPESPLLTSLLAPANNHTEIYQRLSILFEQIATAPLNNENEKMLRAYVLHCNRQLNKLMKAIDESKVNLSLPVFTNMLHKLFSHESIPFTGEPLLGLQVVGILETRNLDFENVIMLSSNEGIMPKSLNVPSFIPYNLRRGMGLPAIEQHEAVYAYYFYRLLQRAKKITLVYNTSGDESRNGEASRYLMQLKMESGHTVTERNVSFLLNMQEPASIVVKKEESVMSELQKYMVTGDELRVTSENTSKLQVNTSKLQVKLSDNSQPVTRHSSLVTLSPSALNTYLSCSLRFYYRYVAHLKMPDEMAEDVDSRLLGNILHHAMEALYKPLEGKSISAETLKAIAADKPKILDAINRSMAREYYHDDTLPDEATENGKLMLLHDVTLKYIQQIINYDISQAPFTLEGTEIKFEHPLPIESGGETATLTLGGIIDRMDRKGNALYVVDYKTGAVKNEFKSIAALFGADNKQHNPAVLQVMLYSVLLKQKYPEREVVPQLYFMRELYNKDVNFSITDKENKCTVDSIAPYAENFTATLTTTLSELFNPAVPFSQTSDLDTCTYCDYRQLCSR